MDPNVKDFLHLTLLLINLIKVYKEYQENCFNIMRQLTTSGNSRQGISYWNIATRTKLGTKILELNNRVIKKHLRISAKQFVRLDETLPLKREGWLRRIELMVFLHWLASGASYRMTGIAFNTSRYVIKTIVHNLLNEFEELVPKMIKHPEPHLFESIGEGFCRRANTPIFKNAIGAIDSCRINIKCPVSRDEYINRELKYSIQLQAVCDHTGKFIDIFVGHPGSSNDQHVLSNSPLYLDKTFPPRNYFLLGDCGYKCCVYPIAIITPVKESRQLTEKEIKFNNLHSRSRNIIEYSFGIMKSRWRTIFNNDLELKTAYCVKMIAACCVLHNVFLTTNNEFFDEDDDIYLDDEFDDLDYIEGYRIKGGQKGIELRNSLINDL